MKKLLILILFFPLVALASGDKNINVTDVATGDVTTNVVNDIAGGDVSIVGGSSKALGLGRSSFDVDINQCMGSTAWDTVIGGRQKLVINWVCLAEFYLKTGKPDLAAVAICNTEMLKEFDSEEECEQAHDFFIEVSAALEPAVIMEDTHWEDEEDYRREQEEEQAAMQQDYDERIQMLESRVNAPPPPQQHVPDDLDDQIAAAAARRAKARDALKEFKQ